jgi:uncharacterized protein YecT (DUF1311 family)
VKFKVAQERWLAWRTAENESLDALYDGFQGTMYSPMRAHARMDITAHRARELTALLAFYKEHQINRN